MQGNNDKKHDPRPALPDPKQREVRAKEAGEEQLDFAKLDLRVETVEERISPSETNVFDK